MNVKCSNKSHTKSVASELLKSISKRENQLQRNWKKIDF